MLLALAVPGAAAPAAEEDEIAYEEVAAERSRVAEIGAKTMDAMLLRPLGAVSTLAGLPFFLVSAPMLAPTGAVGDSWDLFVQTSADYTFKRALGEF